MKFIDTVTLFAGFFVDEKHHVKAKEVVAAIAEGKVRDAVYSDYVLDELLTLARAKKGAAVSNEILEEIANSEIKMEKVEQRHLSLAMELFKSYEKLSFTDCTTVALMLDLGIKEIYSFDKGFDSVAKIVRLEEL
ncbi:MAG: PilT protein [archaeon GW2011_AR10]|uniref:Type II toxin-antitoxin system VapC family toxin n=1 Tax=Candidatus Iainarchaeum sp. TaxID=3101447 RepID=A0A7J4IVC8_9ARCH|nr:MAG: PilT protein [archaeon GW2011_AR10]HIH08770.1 type II toxin-antitoxin system VapC family toxin [Candidatus Diapherotrites archaeon]